MTTYVTYQCSICRRTKDIAQDNVRVLPDQCNITKGCRGSLYKVGETGIASSTPPVLGLTNWYPRGQKLETTEAESEAKSITLSTSPTGVVTLALLMTDEEAQANPSVVLVAKQQLSADVPFTEYVYSVLVETAIISGKDTRGRNLRFSQSVIDNDQLQVLVNGVVRNQGDGANDYVAAPNVITFNTALPVGSIVNVSVFGVAPTITQTLTFTANYSFIASDTSGAWGNIRWADEYDAETGSLISTTDNKKWWLYSCTSLGALSSAALLKVTEIQNSDQTILIPGTLGQFSESRFLLASPPYDNSDRYLNFYVDLETLASDFMLSSQVTTTVELQADRSALVDIYPPLQLINNENLANSSYVTADTFPADDAVSLDTPEERLTASRIIGPL